jgi:hypothetical protein
MRRLNPPQQQMLADSARSIEDAVALLKKRHARLAAHGVLPRFVRVLLDAAETELADAAAGLVDWADGHVDDDGLDAWDRADTIDLTTGDQDEDFGN